MTFHKHLIAAILLSFSVCSCLPLSIAPDLEEGKTIRAKKFKRKLPNRHSYIFTDPKPADEFYYYINTKFDCQHTDVENNVPVEIGEKLYYFSFYETEKSTRVINLINPIVNRALDNKGITPILNEDNRARKVGTTWYIVLMVTDEDFNDALHPNYGKHSEIAAFAKAMQAEYLSMSNYNQAILDKAGQ